MHRNDQSGRELQLTARNAQDIDIAIMKLFRVLYQRPDNLPVFNFAVKTGRGVQLWLRLESCAAVPMFTALYHDICVRLCAELQAVIEKNGIGLTVDTNASCDATRSVRLPFTHNSKRRDFVTYLFHSVRRRHCVRQSHYRHWRRNTALNTAHLCCRNSNSPNTQSQIQTLVFRTLRKSA